MTYLQNDAGNIIDLPDDFTLTSSAVDLFNFSIKGDISTTFRLPNNSYYKNSFTYWGPLQQPSQGFNAVYFNLVKNGNVIRRGKLYLEREDWDFMYFCFIGGNANWINKIQEKVKDLVYDDFSMVWKQSQIEATSGATSGFCFPFVDWAYKFYKTKSYYSIQITDVDQNTQKCYNDFYPCFFLKSALQEIFAYYGMQIGGDLLLDPVYQKMIITPDSGVIKRAPKFLKDRQSQV